MKRPDKKPEAARRFSLNKNMRMEEEDAARLEALAARWRCSESAAVRRALAEAAKREGVDPGPR